MAGSPQDPPRYAGHVVRRVLLRRNIAIDPETAQLVAAAVLGVTCWVINNGDRSDRVTRMILARHGDTRCLATGSPATSSPSSRPRHRRRPGAAG